jgi:hypothetical protein
LNKIELDFQVTCNQALDAAVSEISHDLLSQDLHVLLHQRSRYSAAGVLALLVQKDKY